MAKIIKVSRHSVLVDDEDYEWLNDLHTWRVTNHGRVQLSKSPFTALMSHLIAQANFAELPEKYEVLHKDENPLNNQKSNLIIATSQQRTMTRKSVPNSSSKYKGVCFTKDGWQAAICKDGQIFYLGKYQDERHAAMAYDIAAKDLFGEFARLNFPDAIHH